MALEISTRRRSEANELLESILMWLEWMLGKSMPLRGSFSPLA